MGVDLAVVPLRMDHAPQALGELAHVAGIHVPGDLFADIGMVELALLDVEQPLVIPVRMVAIPSPASTTESCTVISGPEAWMATNGPMASTAVSPGMPNSASPSTR